MIQRITLIEYRHNVVQASTVVARNNNNNSFNNIPKFMKQLTSTHKM